jgi:signal transduction histidine kinase
MVHMANDLAAFARGDRQIHVAPINLDELFARFRELNAPLFTDKRAELVMQGNAICLQGDGEKLLRVLQNLIGNAMDALRKCEHEGKVTVCAEETDTHVVLTVEDNGPGIPEDIRETLFDPFVTKGKSEGTGLGTAIVKSIVDAHQGDIQFKTGSMGTTFTIRLPKEAPST